MRRDLNQVIEIARQNKRGISFHVSKADRRRWNWLLTARYQEQDPATGEYYPVKTVLRTTKVREDLEMMRKELEEQYSDN